MTAFADSANQSAAEQPHIDVVHFALLDFPDGILRCCTHTSSLTWGGETWLAAGQFGGISEIAEDAMLRPNGCTLTLSGMDATVANAAMNEDYHGRTVAVYEGYMSGGALIAAPELLFRGIMDVMTIEVGATESTVSVQCEGELARWERHSGLLYTHESQQQVYPGDNFFDQLPLIQNKTISWVKKAQFGTIGAWYRAHRAMTGK